jgi:pyruvate/2-oxoglutarate dehydrogenase complex dihydrolipoamide dehydrogenase (E3) component
MTAEQHYDTVVIGSRQGGKPLAGALVGAGHKTAIIEREHVGGSCVNVGCTPTKTMIASARAAYVDRRSADYGVYNGPVTVEMTEVRRRKRDIVDGFRDGVRQVIESTKGLDPFLGEARFTGPKELQVDLNDGHTVRLSADNIFINVGARPLNPPIEGLDSVPTLNSTSIMELGFGILPTGITLATLRTISPRSLVD